MNSFNLIFIKNGILKISGNITFENIVEILNLCFEKTKNIKQIKIDFKDLSNSNSSSTLIFIINYIRNVKQQNKTIVFMNIPLFLIKLTKIYNLNSIIPICN
ncbi:MAG TPA: STAS domain-containing protein [Candidatus Azoamicus sp. OHIO1]